MGEDEDVRPVREALQKVKASAAGGSQAAAAASTCPDGICGLGSDGACGLGSDDRDVAEAGLVGAGEDLAADQTNAREIAAKSSVTSSAPGCVGGHNWEHIRSWAPLFLMVLAPMILMSQRRGRWQ